MILFVFEGERREPIIFTTINFLYFQHKEQSIVCSFGNNIYKLYSEMKAMDGDGDIVSLMSEILKSKPGNPLSGIDHSSLYGAKLYDSARKKLVPVFGVPSGKSIAFKKSDKTMIVAPMSLEGHQGIYAVKPNSKRLAGYIPENAYVFADSETPASVGDLAVCIDVDFAALDSNTVANAQIVSVRSDSRGKIYGQISAPEEKIVGKTMHRVVMIVME